ncbi:hypothetical protein FGIG_08020 [Fasciola gigantica]|uniref:Uncharacterized protein n=1 Tax=Fasciola gigantica TaxID=46835 RepID=A0A504ZBT4_FASGI|nr:hypothetical protein FGIG_08020 [Fasciola gigantica]
MSELKRSIKVLNGIYLPHEECANLTPGSVPVGEEATEHMLFSEPIYVPQLQLDLVILPFKVMNHVMQGAKPPGPVDQKRSEIVSVLCRCQNSRCRSVEPGLPVCSEATPNYSAILSSYSRVHCHGSTPGSFSVYVYLSLTRVNDVFSHP